MLIPSSQKIIATFFFYASIFFLVFLAFPAHAAEAPRTVNYYLSWNISQSDATKLAEWDMLILDMEHQVRNPELLKQLRKDNPDIIIFAYITPQEILKDTSGSTLRQILQSNIENTGYLVDSTGNTLSYWPGTYLLNITNASLRNTVTDFVADTILSTGLWDGVFYDNAWGALDWAIPGGNVDFDRNGTNDLPQNGNGVWTSAMHTLYQETRKKVPADTLIVGNGWTDIYADVLDGMMIESFDKGQWSQHMTWYKNNHRPGGSFNMINANTKNTGFSSDYRAMRFGLTSALLEDGYYSYDFGNKNHGQTWQYDEYGIDLGSPLAESTSKSQHTEYNPDVWQREYEHGLSIVNSLPQEQTITLNGEYEKIHGTQDTIINDGSIITEVSIGGYDGLVLLKTFDSLDDVLFQNGAFLRFLRPDGSRVRNGFFVFEEGYKGGDQIAHIDLNGDGKRELLVVSRNKILAWRHDGQPYINQLYPYTANYSGNIRVMIGDINNDSRMEIYVAPEAGFPAPIKVYTRYGYPLRNDWFPFGEGYRGGYTLALGGFQKVSTKNIVLGSGIGVEPRVGIYTWDYQLLNSWNAFEPSFLGGVNVAAGDINGNGLDEVVIGAGVGKKPIIRVFNNAGDQQGEDIVAYTSFGSPGIDVLVQDVDFDGKDDIIGVSNDAF